MATDFLGVQLQLMAVNFRLNLSPQDKSIQKNLFKPLLDKWGEARFKACVDGCMAKHSTGFFPSVGELQAYDLGPSGNTYRANTDDGFCSQCRGEKGWLRITKFDERVGHEIETNTRCTHPQLTGAK